MTGWRGVFWSVFKVCTMWQDLISGGVCSCDWECPPRKFSMYSCSRQQRGTGRPQRTNRNSRLDQDVQICWRRWQKYLWRQLHHFVGHSVLHWQPVEWLEKWSTVGLTSVLRDNSCQVVLSPLQDVVGGGEITHRFLPPSRDDIPAFTLAN